MLRAGHFNFSKGEIAEELVARVDVQSYNSAVKTARNVLVLKYGGLTKRPGTRLVGEAFNATTPVRLLPFQFSLTQAYALEMGQGYMRPLALGGMVLETKLKITAITKAANAKVTSAYHGYSVGDQVYFSGVLGMTQINGLTGKVVTVPDANNYTVDIDSTGFSTFTGDTGGIVNSAPPPPPPPPPPVPPPPPPPPPPTTTESSGPPDDPILRCVTLDTPILMADRSTKAAGEIVAGDRVYTRHETTLEWGAFRVDAVTISRDEDILSVEIAGVRLRATPNHRVYIDGAWRTMTALGGVPDGKADVVKMTVRGAHTYISAGVLSHNIKQQSYL